METGNSAPQMDEWELSKENVQPLKSGRKVEHLTAALQQQTQPNSIDHRQQIILQRQALETELRCYSGDDPIEPWEQYIRWTEKTFPRGGKESNMRLLLERCVQLFKDEPRYKNDTRYVSTWLKLASSFSNDPLEMYQFMRDQGIGFKVAKFYEAWAWQLEQLGNTKKAESVYQEGINCKAEPEGRLEVVHREFQFRVARSTMAEFQEAQYDEPDSATRPGQQRNALGVLKGRGKLQKVGTQRTGAAVKTRTSGGLGLQAAPSQIGQNFTVFCDDAPKASAHASGGATALPAPTGEWENIPTQQTRKENERSAGPWTGGQRSGHRSTAVGLDEASQYSKQNFTVHVDDNPQPITTPHKLPEMGSQVLSVRKPKKQPEDSLKHIKQDIFASNDGQSRVMYCKHLIYGGTTEMSIEEIRAIKVKAKKEERRLAEEREVLRKRQESLQEQQQLMIQKQEEFERKVQERLEQQQMRHEEELKRFQQQQHEREQDLQQKMMTIQSQPPPTQLTQENNQPRQPMQNTTSKVTAVHIDQENPSMTDVAPSQPMLMSRPAMIDRENPPRMPAVPRQPMQSLSHRAGDAHASQLPQQPQISNGMPLTAPTPEEQHSITVDKAQQQLQALRQQRHHHQLNESVCNNQKEGSDNNRHHSQDGDPTGNFSVTQQLQFDDVTKTVNMQEVIAQISHPTPTLSNIAPHAANTTTPNMSGIINTSAAQVKTPLNRSLLPDSRTSSHSGRLTRITPSHTPGGITAPSPTVNTKEALGTIMAMLNNPLAVDEVWRPPLSAQDASSSSTEHRRFNFENEFGKDDVNFVKPAKKCAFTIATDEYEHLDNQENNPPKDFIAPQPDCRPRSGILQPSTRVPVLPQEDQEETPAAVHMEQQHQDQPDDEADNMMEGIEPIKEDEDERHLTNHHESTMMHHSTQSAFETAARMASTPFNPQSGSERPSFSPMSSIKAPMSSIKAPMDGSMHRPEPNRIPTSNHQPAPFTIAADPDPVALPPVPALPEHIKEGEDKANGAVRVEVSGLESFDVNETTINPPSRLSPIMETSAEDHQSSGSSNGSRSQSQAASLTASHIQHQYAATNESQHLQSGFVNTRKRSNSGSSGHSSDNSQDLHISQHVNGISSFVNGQYNQNDVPSSSSMAPIDQHSAFQIACDDQPMPHSTSLSQSQMTNSMRPQHNSIVSNELVGDLSSLMISEHVNDQPTHQSIIEHGMDTGTSELRQQHSSKPLDCPPSVNMDNDYRAMHESIMALMDDQNKSIEESFHKQPDQSLQNQSTHPVEQNMSLLNHSALPPKQDQSILNFSAHVVEQNQSLLNHSTLPAEQNQSVLNYSSRPVEQNQSLLNHSALPSKQDLSILNYSARPVDQNQSVLNHSALPAEQNQSILNYSSRPVEQNQSLLNHSSLPAKQAQSILNYSARPVEQNQSLLNHSALPAEQNQSILNYSSRPVEQNQSLLNHSALPSKQDQSVLNYSALPVEQSQSLVNHSTIQVEQNQSVLNHSTIPTEKASAVVNNPWNEGLRHDILARITPQISAYRGYEVIQSDLPDIEAGLAVSLGDELYTIAKQVGQGAFAKIYSAGVLGTDDFELTGGDKEVAMKVESPACPWEFYISRQIHSRLKALDGVDVTRSIMSIDNAYLFDNGSCLITDLNTEGTLLDLVNMCVKDTGEPMSEPSVLYFAIELLHVMEKMHACQIIHGDIKPDNILVANMSDWRSIDSATALHGYTKYIKLIDMGRGIDMTQFAPGTVFNAKSGTSGFDCIEMKTDRPWTYQTDLYGLAGTLNCMLSGTYMNPYYEGGRWKITCKTKRWYKANWKDIFDSLLNIPSCDELPSLSAIRQHMEEVLRTHHMDTLVSKMTRLAILL